MSLSIEEVDKRLRFGNPSSKIPAYLVWSLTLIYWGLGTYWIIKSIMSSSPLLVGFITLLSKELIPLITSNMSLITTYLALLISVIFITSFILLILIKKIARIILMVILILSLIFDLAVGIISLFFGNLIFGVISFATAFVLIFIMLKYWDRIKFVGRLVELSSSIVLHEKGTILATVLSMIINSYTLITMSFANLFIADYIVAITGTTEYGYYTWIILEFFGLWTITFIATFFNAVIVGITHDWYRSPSVDVASFNRGLRRASKVQGGIAIYAFVVSILRILIEIARSQARSQRGRGGAGVITAALAMFIAFILGIALELFRFFSFFIVPAMVIRETGFKDGFKESLNKLRDLFIEVIASEIGFGKVAGFFTFIYLTLLGGIGYVIGAYVLTPIFLIQYNVPAITVGIISAVIFFLVGLIPASVIFSTLSVVFNTLLYEYGVDLEFAKRGESLPRNMPSDIEEEFMEILRKRGISIPLSP